MDIRDFTGVIEDKSMKEDKNGKPYFDFEISNEAGKRKFKWFVGHDAQGEEIAKSLKKGDQVEGMAEITEKEYMGKQVTFRNIKEMHKTGEGVVMTNKEYPKNYQEYKEQQKAIVSAPDRSLEIELGQAKNIAAEMIKIIDYKGKTEEELFKKYRELVITIFEINKNLKKELLG